jgi:cyd operon protein YbgT
MWRFTWIPGPGLTLAFAIINALWLETSYAFAQINADSSFESSVPNLQETA